MRILILTQYPFPYGLAQTNRLIAIAKGLVHAGADVVVTCIKPTEKEPEIRNKNVVGEIENVKFIYPGETTIRSSFFITRIINHYNSLLSSLIYIFKQNRLKKVDVLFMGFTSSFNTIIFFLVTRLLKIKYVQERSEFPFLSYNNSIIGKLSLNFYLHIVCKTFDAFIVITKSLDRYFKPYLRKKSSIFLLPILVDPERFAFNIERPQKNITYCGSMEGNKDGVPVLIDAFHIIASDFPEYKLILIGNTEFIGFEKLQKQIKEKGLEEKVIFAGRVERDKLPGYLAVSSVLALARPSSKQAEGGFPTKLGEYLATGRPVVITKVGEIGDFLVDGLNAAISEPDSAHLFSEKLRFILNNYELSENMGAEGQKLAKTVFNYQFQGENLFNWLKTI